MTSEELTAYVAEVSAQCIAEIEKHWNLSPNASLSSHCQRTAFPQLELNKFDWRTTIRYHIAKITVESLHTSKKKA